MKHDNNIFYRARNDDTYNFMGINRNSKITPFSKNYLRRFFKKNNLAIFGSKNIESKSPYIFSLECKGTLPRTSMLHQQGIYKGYVKFCEYFWSKSKGLYMGYYIRILSPENELEQEDLLVFLKITDEILTVIPDMDEQYKIKVSVEINATNQSLLGNEIIIDLYSEERY